MTTDIKSLLLAAIRALLGSIIPEIRAISVDLRDHDVLVWIYYDGYLDEDQLDDLDIITSEIFSMYCYEDSMLESEILRVDAPATIPRNGHLVYLRKEE